jgi:hypothetical protein
VNVDVTPCYGPPGGFGLPACRPWCTTCPSTATNCNCP